MTFQHSTYQSGGVLVSREVWDSIALTVTVFDGQGNQLSSRALTPGETAEIVAKAAGAAADTNREILLAKADAALAANGKPNPGGSGYLGSAAIPAGAALTTAQLTTVVRALRAQVDSLSKQNNALIRLLRDKLADVSDT